MVKDTDPIVKYFGQKTVTRKSRPGSKFKGRQKRFADTISVNVVILSINLHITDVNDIGRYESNDEQSPLPL